MTFLACFPTCSRHYYRILTGKKLDIDNPKGFTEKLQWLKLNDRRPEYSTYVDKILAKKYVASIIGEEYVTPTLGEYYSFKKINFDILPKSFVIKCTHGSNCTIVCKDKSSFDRKKAEKIINKKIKKNYYWCGREWPYRDVEKRIIVEKYLEDEKTQELRDYKFFCFNGEPKLLYITQGRFQNNDGQPYADFFDMDFNHLSLTMDHNNAPLSPQKPVCFDQMKKFAAMLSKNIPHVRIDFYEVNGHLYFGEMTFFHCSGFVLTDPPKWEKQLGDWLELPTKT